MTDLSQTPIVEADWRVPADLLQMGRAPRFWQHVLGRTLPEVTRVIPPGSDVLEVGYGDGGLSSWLVARCGWRLTGLDVNPDSQQAALAAARAMGVDTRTDFRVVAPEQTQLHRGQYDAVFIKTVLYTSTTDEAYAGWLDWIVSNLRPGGVLVNYETGRGTALVQAYRRWRGREYADTCLYSARQEQLYDQRFEIVSRQYFGGLSQFLAVLPGVYELAVAVESAIQTPSADSCFAVSTIARRPATERAR